MERRGTSAQKFLSMLPLPVPISKPSVISRDPRFHCRLSINQLYKSKYKFDLGDRTPKIRPAILFEVLGGDWSSSSFPLQLRLEILGTGPCKLSNVVLIWRPCLVCNQSLSPSRDRLLTISQLCKIRILLSSHLDFCLKLQNSTCLKLPVDHGSKFSVNLKEKIFPSKSPGFISSMRKEREKESSVQAILLSQSALGRRSVCSSINKHTWTWFWSREWVPHGNQLDASIRFF